MKTSKIIVLILVLIFISIVICFGLNFAPRSYQYTPKYEFNVSESDLINHINKLKEIDSTLKVPDSYNMVEGRKNTNDYWYHFFVFYSNEQEILNCWVRADTDKSTTLAFVSIMDKNGNWKVFDKGFNNNEMDRQKKIFEERFVNKLKKMLSKE